MFGLKKRGRVIFSFGCTLPLMMKTTRTMILKIIMMVMMESTTKTTKEIKIMVYNGGCGEEKRRRLREKGGEKQR